MICEALEEVPGIHTKGGGVWFAEETCKERWGTVEGETVLFRGKGVRFEVVHQGLFSDG